MSTLLLLAIAIASAATSDPASELAAATHAYDLPGAETLATGMEADPKPEESMLRARAWLLVAELRRIAFEELPVDAVNERRALGRRIDAAADSGLAATQLLEECSEKHRIRADLLGTKIRSRFRAGKYKDEMNRAIATALELDPENASALISKAKTYLLRPDADGEAIRRGQELVEQALARDSSLEQARLLQAYTWEQLGHHDRARAGYEQCLQLNRNCTPASAGLTRLNK
ncbi:MAG: hypothetical protein KF886_26325 [Candidatus Hydrogenedentes bacterium]|nr:hypothetical protein [Candidatus Hydrogenedentota bacterium]